MLCHGPSQSRAIVLWFSGKWERLSQGNGATTPDSTWHSGKKSPQGGQLSHHSSLVGLPPDCAQRDPNAGFLYTGPLRDSEGPR